MRQIGLKPRSADRGPNQGNEREVLVMFGDLGPMMAIANQAGWPRAEPFGRSVMAPGSTGPSRQDWPDMPQDKRPIAERTCLGPSAPLSPPADRWSSG